MAAKPVEYSDYLRLGSLLKLQLPKSSQKGREAHDETLFIIVHQVYELWFKLILHELDSVLVLFAQKSLAEKDVGKIVSRLRRITEIQKILIDQFRVLETMTPLDFLEFRDLLTPSSGFQSLQFRLIENKLGLRPTDRLDYIGCPYHSYVPEASQRKMLKSEAQTSLFTHVEGWLERTPFLELGGYRFWDSYRVAVTAMLDNDAVLITKNPRFSSDMRKLELKKLETTRLSFAPLFDQRQYDALLKKGVRRLSRRALLAALFIHLYRDEPILHPPFRLLTALLDVDELFTEWRHRHALMVRRMIGAKIGTGGSSGYGYLNETVAQNKIFSDLVDLPTFFVARHARPPLPANMAQRMNFSYAAAN